MNVKAISVGVVAVLVIAAIGSVVVITNQNKDSNNSDNNDEVFSFNGKWNLYYYEHVSLVDDDHKPIYDANKCDMERNMLDIKNNPITMEIKMRGDIFFTGTFNNITMSGTVTGNTVDITEEFEIGDTHRYVGVGYLKGGYFSLSYSQMDLETEQICCAGYAMFIPEGKEAISHLTDRVNFKDLTLERVDATAHTIDDFINNHGVGTPLPSLSIEYVKSWTMVSLFKMKGEGENTGLQVLISNGVSSHDIVFGSVTGNAKFDKKNYGLIGDFVMSNGKFMIRQSYHLNAATVLVNQEYNVNYDKGDLPPTSFLNKNYVGTVKMWDKNGAEKSEVITKDFMIYRNVIYGVEVFDSVKYEWFGTITGYTIDLFVISEKYSGIVRGEIAKDGTIVLYGILHNQAGEPMATEYVLQPKVA